MIPPRCRWPTCRRSWTKKATPWRAPAGPGASTLTLHVLEAQGQTIPGAQVRWSTDMTNMAMGPQGGQMTDLGAGKYQTRAQFSMGGPWRITVNVIQAGQALGTGYF